VSRRCIRQVSHHGKTYLLESIFRDMVADECEFSETPYTAVKYSLSMKMPTSKSLRMVSVASAVASIPLATLHILLGVAVWPILLIPFSVSLAELRLHGMSTSRLATFITSLTSLVLGLV
jgi:hypothetical protein